MEAGILRFAQKEGDQIVAEEAFRSGRPRQITRSSQLGEGETNSKML
jgi:hypothetical protein